MNDDSETVVIVAGVGISVTMHQNNFSNKITYTIDIDPDLEEMLNEYRAKKENHKTYHREYLT